MGVLQWESVKQNEGGLGPLRRAKVPGGWLLLHGAAGDSSGFLFLPDPRHEWDVDTEAERALPMGRGWDHR